MIWTSESQVFPVLIGKLLPRTLKSYKLDLYYFVTTQIELIWFNSKRGLQYKPDELSQRTKTEVKG